MIAAPHVLVDDKRDKLLLKPLMPVPLYGLPEWNRMLVAYARAPA